MSTSNGPPLGLPDPASPTPIAAFRLLFDQPPEAGCMAPHPDQPGARGLHSIPKRKPIAVLPADFLIPLDQQRAIAQQRRLLEALATFVFSKIRGARVAVPEVAVVPNGFWQPGGADIGGFTEATDTTGGTIWVPAAGRHATAAPPRGEHCTRGLHPHTAAAVFIHECCHAVQIGEADDLWAALRGASQRDLHGYDFAQAAARLARGLWDDTIPPGCDLMQFPQNAGPRAANFVSAVALRLDRIAAPMGHISPQNENAWLVTPRLYNSQLMDPADMAAPSARKQERAS
jgi:hypothetical protein